MLIYVINLDRQPARMAKMAAQLAGMDFERVPAVEGRHLNGVERRIGEVPTRAEEMTRYELAVTLSHREVWRRFLSAGSPFCCVLEDDVMLSPHFPVFIKAGDWLPAGATIVKIEACTRRKLLLGRKKNAFKDRFLYPLLSVHLGSAGYIIARDAAARLVSQTEAIARPIDHILFEDLLFDTSFKVYQLVPALCIQQRLDAATGPSPELQSTIQGKKRRLPRRERIFREIRRPFASLGKAAAFVLSGKIAAGSFQRVTYR